MTRFPRPFLRNQTVNERNLGRKMVVEDDAANGGLDDLVLELEHFSVHDVLVVERRGQIHERPREQEPDRAESLHVTGL